MNVGEAAYRMVSGGRTLRTQRAASLQGRMSEVERAAGTKTAAAREAGVTLRTWQRWRAGTQKPRPETLRRLETAQRRARLPRSREGRIRAGRGTLRMVATVRVSKDVRRRGIGIDGEDIDPTTRDALADAFLAGDERALGSALQDAMLDYVPGMDILDVESISFA